MKKKFIVLRNENDGGLQGSGVGEELHDCTVRAIAIALKIKYESAHRLLQVYGRQNGKAFHFYRWMANPGNHLFNLVDHKAKTVGGFIKKHQARPYICTINGHAFAVVDSVIQDTRHIGPRTRIKSVWQPVL